MNNRIDQIAQCYALCVLVTLSENTRLYAIDDIFRFCKCMKKRMRFRVTNIIHGRVNPLTLTIFASSQLFLISYLILLIIFLNYIGHFFGICSCFNLC